MNFEYNQQEQTLTFIKSIDSELMKTLLDLTDDESFYNNQCSKSVQYFYPHLKQLQSRAEAGNFCLFELVLFLNEQFKDQIQQLECMVNDKKVNFENLRNVFSLGTQIIGKTTYDQDIGSIVQDVREQTDDQGNRYFVITGPCVFSKGTHFIQKQQDFVIPFYRGLKRIDDLNVRPITDIEKQRLTDRGIKFTSVGINSHYKMYIGSMWVSGYFGPVKFQAEGRVMIDPTGYAKLSGNNSSYEERNKMHSKLVAEDLLYTCSPFIYGFSFVAKKWGNIFIDQVEDIQFDDHAFDYLVLDPSTKDMIRSLVRANYSDSFKDIISNKSGGCIFLLYGPPGVGKTVTCQAVSELLHKPLYSVTVGELGTNASELETKLQQILQLCDSWNAILLLDEADIFMETRSSKNIARNAMVSIFLRLLEYYQGIMFLTTNRVKNIDPAFHSRISITIGYKTFSVEDRKQVWFNLLKASKIDQINLDIDRLTGLHELNGRQIKNAIRMVQCFSSEKSVPITNDLFDHIIVNFINLKE